MNLDFSEDERAFQAEVRAFLDENLAADLRRASLLTPSIFVEPEIYLRWQAILHAKGWLAYHWPVEHGGAGWTPVQRYIFERECALAHAPHISVQGLRLLAPVLHKFGTAEQNAFFLPRMLSGEHLWCQGYSEPEAGSDLASLRTRAVRDGDHYVVDGTKIWTTNAHLSNWIFCLVRTSTESKPQKGISFLLIDMTTPGISVSPIPLFSGDCELNQVFFDGVRVPAANLVGQEGEGWAMAKYLLEHERGGSCQAPALLVALADLRRAAAGLPGRNGGMLTDDRDFMHRLAMVELAAEGMEVFELQALADLSAGRIAGPKTALTGLYMANIRQAIDRLVIEAHGPAALELETSRPLYSPELSPAVFSQEARLAMPTYLNNRAWSIMAGSNEVMRTIIARTVIGL
jgi:alkylation response protein AidB-like acyl-CoA dehydrogenase